jgi:hypothetical protein
MVFRLFERELAPTLFRLLIAAIDDVPVNLDHPYIDLVVKLDIETATESHREAGLVSMKVADAEERR